MNIRLFVKNNRAFIVMTLALLTGIGACAWGLISSGYTREEYRISVIVGNPTDARWDNFRSGLAGAAGETGVRINYVTTDIGGSLEKECQLMQQEIDSGADALIVQLCASDDTEEMLFDLSSRAAIELVTTDGERTENDETLIGCIQADNRALGQDLAEEIIHMSGGSLKGKKVGIVGSDIRTSAVRESYEAVRERITKAGGEVAFVLSEKDTLAELIRRNMEEFSADYIVALDNDALETAAGYVRSVREEKGAEGDIYLTGTGTSPENLYALGKGEISVIAATHDYDMGYNSVKDVYAWLAGDKSSMDDQIVKYTMVNGGNMYEEDNEKILFPIGE